MIEPHFAEFVYDYRRIRKLRIAQQTRDQSRFPLPRNPLTTFTGVVIVRVPAMSLGHSEIMSLAVPT